MKMIKKYNDIILLSLLWIISLYSITKIIQEGFTIDIKNYIGYGLLVIITILRIFKKAKIKTMIMVLLILGTANLIQFTYWSAYFNLLIGPSVADSPTYGLQPTSFYLLLLFILLNINEILQFMFEDSRSNKKKNININ